MGLIVASDRILEVADGKVRPVVPRPTFSTTAVPWAGFLIEGGVSVVGPQPRRTLLLPTLYLCNRGQGRLSWKQRGVFHKYHIVRGSVCIRSPRSEIEDSEVSNAWHFLALALDTDKFRHQAPKEAEGIENSLVQFVLLEDTAIASLMTAMHAEAKAGCPSGALYAESLSLALLSYLTGRHTDRQPGNDRAGLTPVQKRRVVELIKENLDKDVAVSDLAAAIGVSAAHFARLFKASFGVSPHRFIMWERVARAKELLAQSHWSVGYIGVELGFSSHSHFTKVFHSFVGVTPRQFRDRR
jgi:AraC family transcriptional regulator